MVAGWMSANTPSVPEPSGKTSLVLWRIVRSAVGVMGFTGLSSKDQEVSDEAMTVPLIVVSVSTTGMVDPVGTGRGVIEMEGRGPDAESVACESESGGDKTPFASTAQMR